MGKLFVILVVYMDLSKTFFRVKANTAENAKNSFIEKVMPDLRKIFYIEVMEMPEDRLYQSFNKE